MHPPPAAPRAVPRRPRLSPLLVVGESWCVPSCSRRPAQQHVVTALLSAGVALLLASLDAAQARTGQCLLAENCIDTQSPSATDGLPRSSCPRAWRRTSPSQQHVFWAAGVDASAVARKARRAQLTTVARAAPSCPTLSRAVLGASFPRRCNRGGERGCQLRPAVARAAAPAVLTRHQHAHTPFETFCAVLAARQTLYEPVGAGGALDCVAHERPRARQAPGKPKPRMVHPCQVRWVRGGRAWEQRVRLQWLAVRSRSAGARVERRQTAPLHARHLQWHLQTW